MHWGKYQEIVLPYIVRIETAQGSGTGFLFAYNESKAIAAIATAAHVVVHADDWKLPIKLVHATSGKEVFLTDQDRIVQLDRRRDSASIIFRANALPPLPQDLVPLNDPEFFTSVGSEVAWMGYPSVAYPNLCFFRGAISAFLISDDCYLIDGVAINGVSGGPVFRGDIVESKPQVTFIGSVSSYLPNWVSGSTLPGLLRAQDISHFQDVVKSIKDLDEARKEEAAKKNEKKEQPSVVVPQAQSSSQTSDRK